MTTPRRNWREEVVPPGEMSDDDIRAELRHDLDAYERVSYGLSKRALAVRIERLVAEMDSRTGASAR